MSVKNYESCDVYINSKNGFSRYTSINGTYIKPKIQRQSDLRICYKFNEHKFRSKKTRLFIGDTSVGNPLTLQDIVLEFICDHSNRLESLQGYPEILGEEIFTQCLLKGKLTNLTDILSSAKLLELFLDAYGSLVINTLSLKNSLIAMNEYECIYKPCLRYISALDLSHCHIGGDHYIFDCISHMMCLKALNLLDNSLTAKSLRKITKPVSMFRKGPLNLSALNISDNPDIGLHAVISLSCFKKLNYLDVSCTSVKRSDLTRISEEMNFQLYKGDKTEGKVLEEISSNGWAAELMEYMKESLPTVHPKNSPSQKFYSSAVAKRIDQVNNSFPKIKRKVTKLILCRFKSSKCNEVTNESKIMETRAPVSLETDHSFLLNFYGSAGNEDRQNDNSGLLHQLSCIQ